MSRIHDSTSESNIIPVNREISRLQIDKIKQTVRRWIEIDEILRAIQEQQKSLRLEKTMLQEELVEFMQKNDIQNLNTKSDRLILKQSTTNTMLSSSNLINMLRNHAERHNDISLMRFLSETSLSTTKTKYRFVREVK